MQHNTPIYMIIASSLGRDKALESLFLSLVELEESIEESIPFEFPVPEITMSI